MMSNQIKVCFNGEVRHINRDDLTCKPSMEQLVNAVKDLVPAKKRDWSFELRWRNEEKEVMTARNDEELVEAMCSIDTKDLNMRFRVVPVGPSAPEKKVQDRQNRDNSGDQLVAAAIEKQKKAVKSAKLIGPYPGFLRGYVHTEQGDFTFSTLEEAAVAAKAVKSCVGITKEADGAYTLRKCKTLFPPRSSSPLDGIATAVSGGDAASSAETTWILKRAFEKVKQPLALPPVLTCNAAFTSAIVTDAAVNVDDTEEVPVLSLKGLNMASSSSSSLSSPIATVTKPSFEERIHHSVTETTPPSSNSFRKARDAAVLPSELLTDLNGPYPGFLVEYAYTQDGLYSFSSLEEAVVAAKTAPMCRGITRESAAGPFTLRTRRRMFPATSTGKSNAAIALTKKRMNKRKDSNHAPVEEGVHDDGSVSALVEIVEVESWVLSHKMEEVNLKPIMSMMMIKKMKKEDKRCGVEGEDRHNQQIDSKKKKNNKREMKQQPPHQKIEEGGEVTVGDEWQQQQTLQKKKKNGCKLEKQEKRELKKQQHCQLKRMKKGKESIARDQEYCNSTASNQQQWCLLDAAAPMTCK